VNMLEYLTPILVLVLVLSTVWYTINKGTK
jgi:hypothetical protein